MDNMIPVVCICGHQEKVGEESPHFQAAKEWSERKEVQVSPLYPAPHLCSECQKKAAEAAQRRSGEQDACLDREIERLELEEKPSTEHFGHKFGFQSEEARRSEYLETALRG